MYNEVANWLDNVLVQDIPEKVVAFCFNLYDDGDECWSMELVGTERFDIDDEDWPCDEVTDFGTREELLRWTNGAEWNVILGEVIGILNQYLEYGKFANVLKGKSGVGVGFVDGDIDVLYSR